MKRKIVMIFLMFLITASTACTSNTAYQSEVEAEPSVSTEYEQETDSSAQLVSTDNAAESKDEVDLMGLIYLEGDSIRMEGSGAEINGSVITITAAGSYQVSGTLNDGQIRVDTLDEGEVELILDGVSITNSTSAPIYILSADDATIKLAAGSVNTVTDGSSYIFDDAESNEPNAAIFSKSDLTIKGSGSLTVNANYNNGIVSKDDLDIKNGVITINAVHDGLKGKDSVEIEDATLTIIAGADGIQSTNAVDAEKGFVTIDSGIINVTAGLDGVQAETILTINGGTITLVTGGGSANSSSNENWGQPGGGRGMENTASTETLESMKGLKAGVNLVVTGGTINIDSADDALHSNDSLTIDGGDFIISSGDDGMHADTSLVINNGNIIISKSYEGIESAIITINDGSIDITSSDDGLNVAGGRDGSAVNGRPGQGNFTESGSYYLYINGGYLVINADGDGLDSNGSIEMNGGEVIVYGPTNNGNGPTDYMGTFNINGGFIVSVGSSGMAQSASQSSAQYSVLYNYTDTQTAGTMLHIESQDGEDIITLVPLKDYQSILFSSSELANGITYNLYSGGSYSGSEIDGLYKDGTYSSGNLVASFTISSIVTSEGAAGNMMGGGGGGRGGKPGGGGDGMQPPGQ